MSQDLHLSPLGKQSEYVCEYSPQLLHPIARSENRAALGIGELLPFRGVDIWNAYELSWLNLNGKPQVAVGRFSIPCDSTHIIESKSFKLYLNSFNQSRIGDQGTLQGVLERDLSAAAGAPVGVAIQTHQQVSEAGLELPLGDGIDDLDVSIDHYDTDAGLLQVADMVVNERLYSRLLKSNCPVTGQPDWGTLMIAYRGKRLCRESLLKYIVSFRQHSDFHEHCVERIFMDIKAITKAESLEVVARYVRRGGLDINPCRSLGECSFGNGRLANQ
ncbi:NADPH-dependent 7-cyano-7-deazaguanine reductase QueF [Aestuariirhabdus litorea]|uniref:NADPH-dependent 7-cyano-7-deazaguanine reductase n=1 Tax=Aestuariirhabdus litorea TaxID=2528527 RepID=A0A3P3VSW3_9GAMM|nr:NADPH-dependent 7-cyano-7-deazaguanine reductase QueF [Aestuariirhabdus litorea]RRJ84569.1 NADPH-dependent 7-cyano-7-deazaguanine reductase QueF [Aestuariirhabdus litorea]RWW97795.1 NADPH-dependent 7-cyano-7-deazaguanine reductase QueF [Endozoicomonadaceae bacterium GTF-13]